MVRFKRLINNQIKDLALYVPQREQVWRQHRPIAHPRLPMYKSGCSQVVISMNSLHTGAGEVMLSTYSRHWSFVHHKPTYIIQLPFFMCEGGCQPFVVQKLFSVFDGYYKIPPEPRTEQVMELVLRCLSQDIGARLDGKGIRGFVERYVDTRVREGDVIAVTFRSLNRSKNAAVSKNT